MELFTSDWYWETVESVLKSDMLGAAQCIKVTCPAHARHAPASRGAPAVQCLLRDENGSHAPAVNSQRHPQNPQLTPWSEEAPAARPPLLVMTQRGIPDVRQEIPDKPCPACAGTGKVLCGNCRQVGLTSPASSPPCHQRPRRPESVQHQQRGTAWEHRRACAARTKRLSAQGETGLSRFRAGARAG